MRYIVVGAGAVGGAIGGRLHEAGHDVVLVARGAHYQALRAGGLRLTTSTGTLTLPVPVVDSPQAVTLRHGDVLVLAVKTQHSEAALQEWAARPVQGGRQGETAAEVIPLVCAQNGVENERLALRRFRQVYGMCVVLPAAHVTAGSVVARCGPYTGALVLGRYPSGVDATARRIAADLESAHLLAPLDAEVMRWKYAKLLGNLAQTVEALCGSTAQGAAAEVTERARAEGAAVLKAAGVAWATAAEMAELRSGKVEAPAHDVEAPAHDVEAAAQGEGQQNDEQQALGSSWQSLARGTGSIEADHLNGEIVLLGRLHGVPTPVNETLTQLANTAAREGWPPGELDPGQLRELADTAAR
ncbi:2-dehydropantoate 2-reductase N-terminal domain-containing protein [Streptomyces sp. 891-h]|uniref:ketopantoate reductase family protein n=1 Tax=Streptomyces sp. 891-h TaxID=2720714 RepID=UPI001FAA163C|nr:2-dehydropantoate 2-reductase N-terminal domain-containing protein [Streptomyces sp. 891-h]UNZ18522.1 ketopantoate reductase family protein [Streptomyces sp. 891-h]